MKPYSMDLRERVLADCDGGMGTPAVAAKYRVSASWVRRLKQRRRESGAVAPRSPRNHRPRLLAPHADRLRELIAAHPDLTLTEIRQRLALAASLGTLWEAIRRLGLTVKKKSSGRPSRIART